MDIIDPPFLPGHLPKHHYPLERFLPPLQEGMALPWLKDKIAQGAWVLDPFGTSPQLALEIARNGYRVLVTANNPIIAFLLDTLAEGFTAADFNGVLNDLAATRKGEERLERHIQSIYSVECPRCHNTIQAKAFIMQSPGEVPECCLITCPHCGDEGERPISPSTLERLQSLTSSNLHHSRALERVTLPDDPIRPNVEQALTYYPSQQLYALFTILNRAESLSLNVRQRKQITALILSVCDEANTLWPYPSLRSRPRQLVIPTRFRENNLWMALEDAVKVWGMDDGPVPLARWPNLPPSGGGICLFPGRLKELAPDLSTIPISSILTVLPRPNQALWTLSALWSGWLWGREAVAPIKNVLARQRYDWGWLASALESAFSSLQPQLTSTTPCFAIIADSEPSFITSALLAADTSDFDLTGISLRSGDNQAQLFLKPAAHITTKTTSDSLESIVRKAIEEYLNARGEPAPYQVLHTVALASLARVHALKSEEDQSVFMWQSRISTHLQHIFSDQDWLTSFGNNPAAIEKNLWWLRQKFPQGYSLADRVEMEVVRFLQKHPGSCLDEIDEAICNLFPGLMTPSLDLIQACLDSYGEIYPIESSKWQLRDSETPEKRRTDLKTIHDLLEQIRIKLGYQAASTKPVVWQDENRHPVISFYLGASAIISRFVFGNTYPSEQCVLVIPGSRVDLLSYKLARDPLLGQVISKSWRIVKFRHLHDLATKPGLDRSSWLERLDSDPINHKATQIEMF